MIIMFKYNKVGNYKLLHNYIRNIISLNLHKKNLKSKFSLN